MSLHEGGLQFEMLASKKAIWDAPLKLKHEILYKTGSTGVFDFASLARQRMIVESK